RTAERLQQRGFLDPDDAEYREPVVPALQHPLVGGPCQHLLQVAEPEALPGAIHRAEELARQLGRVDHARSFEAVVAVAAAFGRIFAEMAEQHRAAAAGRLDQRRQRVEPGPLTAAALLVDLAKPLPRLREVSRRP